MLSIKKIEEIRADRLKKNHSYKMVRFNDFNYSILRQCTYYSQRGNKKDKKNVSDAFIMFDTETSKKYKPEFKDGKELIQQNHIVAWTISIRFFHQNIVTLWGSRPSEAIMCLNRIHRYLEGDITRVYVHNLAYDYVFMRKFMFKAWGYPASELSIKSHYPISINFENGIEFRDSLILFQRSLDKVAKDFNVEHKKAMGLWDYDKLRNQDEYLDQDELTYIEHDTLAGVEALDALCTQLNKHVFSMPYTATGIPREEVRKRGKEEHARDLYKRMMLSFWQYKKAEAIFHGGYTHANRHLKNWILEQIRGFDFTSSYPFCLLSEKYAMEGFAELPDMDAREILKYKETHAFMLKLIMTRPRLKNKMEPMPVLQFSKCVECVNPVLDNGRVLEADIATIYVNEIDLELIINQYDFDEQIATEVEAAHKGYLPRWLTDYIFELFEQKTMLKGGDPVAYALAKAKLNSVYGMMVMKNIREEIEENYETGEYQSVEYDGSLLEYQQKLYAKYTNSYNTILPYVWGVWCTSYAMRNVHDLYKCCEGQLAYSDTDSAYGNGWNLDRIEAYNNRCKKKLIANGYGPVIRNGREYWLGVAETSDQDLYTEFKTLGSKRYCGRCAADGELHLTVAGVPKKGVAALKNDLNNFAEGFIFPGSITGKLTHEYIFIDDIYIDGNGNETGDSINLTSCDYLLSMERIYNWDYLFTEEINIQTYEEA